MPTIQLEKMLIIQSSSVKVAMEMLNLSERKVLFVVDDSRILLGAVTDGDIRRAFLSGGSIESPVSQVMNKSPLFIETETTEGKTKSSKVKEMMLEKNILVVPVLKNSEVVSFKTIEDILQKKERLNPVFIMAGGFGTRLRPMTNNCPKPLLKVGDKPILELTLLKFIKDGFSNFYISTHYMAEMIRDYFGDGSKWGVSIKYIHEEKPLGTGGALSLLPENLVELPLLMINGDILTNAAFDEVLDFHTEHESDISLCVRDYEYQVPYGVVQGNGLNVESIVEKPVQRFYVNTGIYVISHEVVKSVTISEEMDMPSLVEKNMDSGKKVTMYPIRDYWLDIGRMDDYNRAQVDIKKIGLL